MSIAGAFRTAIPSERVGLARDVLAHPATALRLGEWVPWAIIAVGGLLRLAGATGWSLWEDEETTIYFALNPDKPFARAQPLFFRMIGTLFHLTGVSVPAARLLVAGIGILTLVVAYLCARRTCGRSVAAIAVALMALSPGHLFWSQSVRYYVLVLLFQLLGIWSFLEGVTRQRWRWLGLSAVALLLAMATHYSAALILPVYGVFLAIMAVQRGALRRSWIGAGAFGLVLAAFLVIGYTGVAGVRHILQRGDVHSPQFPFTLIAAGVAYFGPPAVALAVLALARVRRWSWEFMFFALLATLPPAELILIRYHGLMFYVLWYYGLVALFGVAVLAAWALVDLWSRSRALVVLVAALALTVYVVELGAYFSTAHGDRPRWRDAAAHIESRVGPVGRSVTPIFAGAPGVVAYYLGVAPAKTMGAERIQALPPVARRPAVESWYITERRLIEVAEREWYSTRCRVSARFPSRMLVRDRTLVVFHCGSER
jgi:dolichyl-phosphate-mannose-protein mannosyltransferase